MASYRLYGNGLLDPLNTLRVVFYDSYYLQNVPAVYCKDYYAQEIAAEESGQSNSTFYTKAYGFKGVPNTNEWICPNLTNTILTKQGGLLVDVLTCKDAKQFDQDFEPNVTCIDESATNATMANQFSLDRQLVSTNFVPLAYHTNQQLQQYKVVENFSLKYNEYQIISTYVEQKINTFKDNFFSESQSETIIAAQFKEGRY